MKSYGKAIVASLFLLALVGFGYSVQGQKNASAPPAVKPSPASGFDGVISKNARQMLEEGKKIFRFDTFGDEEFWGGTHKHHKAIAG